MEAKESALNQETAHHFEVTGAQGLRTEDPSYIIYRFISKMHQHQVITSFIPSVSSPVWSGACDPWPARVNKMLKVVLLQLIGVIQLPNAPP